VLEERTEGWIAGLQMAALSMRDREDVARFITGFSGTNRYILDYLLEEVLAGQSPGVRHFLLYTSILDRLTAPLCDAVIGAEEIRESGTVPGSSMADTAIPASQSILEYLERANLFLVPLDDERIWYRYHHLFADLLRAQLEGSLGAQGVAQLHVRASEWHGENGSLLEAINHASMASDDERVERLIEHHYMEMVSRGEMSGMRFWRGKLGKELVYRRPWLCIYEAYSHAWFGDLDEADRLLEQADRRIRSESPPPDADAMLAHLAYVRSRVTAMRGDIHGAIEFCLVARKHVPAGNLALEFDTRVTLGYEYFLNGDYDNASQILHEAIRAGITAGAIIHTVAASCMMARLYAVQGLLRKAYDTYQTAAQLIPEASEEHRDARALVEAGMADVLCEWNDLDAALVHLERGLALLPLWAKVDDSVLAYVTLARIYLAQANKTDATEAVESGVHLIQTSDVFSEARHAVETAQVKLWLAQGDLAAVDRWAASQAERLGSDDRFGYETELADIARARVLITQNKPQEAIGLLSHLEEAARSAGRMGRVIEILLLQALVRRAMGDSERASLALTKCLTLAEPEGYARVFLDEGQPMRLLLAQWLVLSKVEGLAHADGGPMRDYAIGLLSQFDAEPQEIAAAQEKAPPAGDTSASHVVGSVEPSEQAPGEPEVRPAQDTLVEPLSPRELEVLHLIALGRTNKEIAKQLVVARGTVKAHAASIYRKLDVANRTEAAARARELGILP